jgi:hypothetical protein
MDLDNVEREDGKRFLRGERLGRKQREGEGF